MSNIHTERHMRLHILTSVSALLLFFPVFAQASVFQGSVGYAWDTTGGLPGTSGADIRGKYISNNGVVASLSVRGQIGKQSATPHAQLDNAAVAKTVINGSVGFNVYSHDWLTVEPYIGFNGLLYGDLYNTAAGGGFDVTEKPVSRLVLNEKVAVYQAIAGNISGNTLTKPANLFEFAVGGTFFMTKHWFDQVEVQYNRYVGPGNSLSGTTVMDNIGYRF